MYGKGTQTSGSGMLMPSDCNNSARMIMGVDHDPTVTETSPEESKAEVTVGSNGNSEHRVDKQSYEIKMGGGDTNHVESGGLSQLGGSLCAYAKVVADRGLQDENGVQAAARRGALLVGERQANAWGLLHDLKTQHPTVYQDYIRWAGVDQRARPQVGDALVTFLPDTAASAKYTRNTKAYAALVDVLRKALGGDVKRDGTGEEAERKRREMVMKARGTVRDALSKVVETAEQDILSGKEGLQKLIETHESNTSMLPKVKEQFELMEQEKIEDNEEARTQHNKRLAELKEQIDTMRFAMGAFSVKRQSALGAIQRAQGVVELVGQLLDAMKNPDADATVLAGQALAAIGITPDTTYGEVKTALNQSNRSRQYFGTGVDDQFTDAMSNNDLWNKHWGGVVMTEGSDYLTLENDASTAKHGKMNTKWGFALYGSEKDGQSFHEQMMDTGDFGTFASTVRYTAPGSSEEKRRRGESYEGNRKELTGQQQLDVALSKVTSDEELMEQEIVEVLIDASVEARAELKRRYAVRAPVPEPVRKLVVKLCGQMQPRQQLPRIVRDGTCKPEEVVPTWGEVF